MAQREWDSSKQQIVLSDQQNEFLDWLCGGRQDGESLQTIAKRIGVSTGSLGRWKKDRAFLREWEDRVRVEFTHPETLASQLKVLADKGNKGDTRAIELYWKLIEKISPDQFKQAPVEVSASSMSDDELRSALMAAADGLG